MNTKKFKRTGLAAFLSAVVIFNADAQLTVKGEFRPRGEYRHGYKELPDDSLKSTAAILISQRSRIMLEYKSKKYNVGFSVQDVRIWGNETLYKSTGVYGDNASLDVNEAWVEILLKDTLNTKSSIKVGKQIFKYDDERLLALNNWNQYSVFYDALLYKFSNEKYQIDAGFSLNNCEKNIANTDEYYFGNIYTPDKMKTLDFIHLKRNFGKHINASLIGIASGYQVLNTETIYLKATYGAYLFYEKDKMRLWGSGYLQNGKTKTGKDVNAYFFSLDGSYTINKLTAGAGTNYISGNDASSSGNKEHLFDMLYGAKHGFYGHIDIMDTYTNGGLVDLYGKLSYKINDRHDINADYHLFSLQNNIEDPAYTGTDFKALNKQLGSEIDMVYNYNFNKEINLQLGYCVMLPTASLEMLQQGFIGKSTFANWAYVMLTVKPVFFKSEK